MTEQAFPDMPEPTTPSRITFLGVRTQSLADVFKMGAQHEFRVSGEVVHVGPKKKKDGTIYQLVQVEVDAVTPLSYDEPASGAITDEPAVVVS